MGKYALLTLDVHASVCVAVKSHLTSQMSNQAINECAHLVACELVSYCQTFQGLDEFLGWMAQSLFSVS